MTTDHGAHDWGGLSPGVGEGYSQGYLRPKPGDYGWGIWEEGGGYGANE